MNSSYGFGISTKTLIAQGFIRIVIISYLRIVFKEFTKQVLDKDLLFKILKTFLIIYLIFF